MRKEIKRICGNCLEVSPSKRLCFSMLNKILYVYSNKPACDVWIYKKMKFSIIKKNKTKNEDIYEGREK